MVRGPAYEALLKTGKVGQREAVKTLRLTGEVQLDQTRVVDVPPTASGRVIQVRKFLGQPVAKGDVLAVVHSGDFGEAKAAYLGAHAQHEIARKEQERQAAVAAVFHFLRVPPLQRRSGNSLPEAHSDECKACPTDRVGCRTTGTDMTSVLGGGTDRVSGEELRKHRK